MGGKTGANPPFFANSEVRSASKETAMHFLHTNGKFYTPNVIFYTRERVLAPTAQIAVAATGFLLGWVAHLANVAA